MKIATITLCGFDKFRRFFLQNGKIDLGTNKDGMKINISSSPSSQIAALLKY